MFALAACRHKSENLTALPLIILVLSGFGCNSGERQVSVMSALAVNDSYITPV